MCCNEEDVGSTAHLIRAEGATQPEHERVLEEVQAELQFGFPTPPPNHAAAGRLTPDSGAPARSMFPDYPRAYLHQRHLLHRPVEQGVQGRHAFLRLDGADTG